MERRQWVAMLLLVALLGSCGGDDDIDGPTDDSTPSSEEQDDGGATTPSIPDECESGSGAVPDSVTVSEGCNRAHGGDHCYYLPNQLLAAPMPGQTEVRVDEVVRALEDVEIVADPEDERALPSVHLFTLDRGDPLMAADYIRSLDIALAAPNYIVSFAPKWRFQPGGLAQREAPPPGREGEARNGPVIGILDTGFDPSNWPGEALGEEPTFVGSAAVDVDEGPVAGHGTFIAALVARWAPTARVVVDRPAEELLLAEDADGRPIPVTDDRQVAVALQERLLNEDDNPFGGVDILNLSLGGYACGDVGWTIDDVAVEAEPVRELISLRDVLANVPDGMIVTAAAGNDGHADDPRFYPAAWSVDPVLKDKVISVGTADPAATSNQGPWITTSATGNVLSHRPPQEAMRGDPGWYRWAGTSFAAPCVAAHIANEMIGDDTSGAVDAWARLARRQTVEPPTTDGVITDDVFECVEPAP